MNNNTTETYRGRTIELGSTNEPERVHSAGTQWESVQPAWVRQWVRIDGRGFRRPAGTDEQVLAKIRKGIDTDIEDAEIIADLVGLVGQPSLPIEEIEAPEVGQVAAIYAMGRYRTGRILKVTKTKATIAYTTASSGGRVFRKAGSFA